MCNRHATLFRRSIFAAVIVFSIPLCTSCKKPEIKPTAKQKRPFADYVMFSNINGANSPEMDISHRLKRDRKLNKTTDHYYKRKKRFDEFDIVFVHQDVPGMDILTSRYVFGDREKCNFINNDQAVNIENAYCVKLYSLAKNLARNKFDSKELPYKACDDCTCIYMHINFQGKIYEVFDCHVDDYDEIINDCNECDLKNLCAQDNIDDKSQLDKYKCEKSVFKIKLLCEEFKLGKTPDGKIRSTEYFDKTCKETNDIKELIDMLFMVENGKK